MSGRQGDAGFYFLSLPDLLFYNKQTVILERSKKDPL
jgi:hypothetical protein